MAEESPARPLHRQTGATASRFAAGELAHLSPPSHAPLLGGLGEPESASAVISEQARRMERLRTQNAALESKARVLEATQAKLGPRPRRVRTPSGGRRRRSSR